MHPTVQGTKTLGNSTAMRQGILFPSVLAWKHNEFSCMTDSLADCRAQKGVLQFYVASEGTNNQKHIRPSRDLIF